MLSSPPRAAVQVQLPVPALPPALLPRRPQPYHSSDQPGSCRSRSLLLPLSAAQPQRPVPPRRILLQNPPRLPAPLQFLPRPEFLSQVPRLRRSQRWKVLHRPAEAQSLRGPALPVLLQQLRQRQALQFQALPLQLPVLQEQTLLQQPLLQFLRGPALPVRSPTKPADRLTRLFPVQAQSFRQPLHPPGRLPRLPLRLLLRLLLYYQR